ncbi:MAG: polysaccharide deacetylase family protein [Bacilli bacterium]
MNKKKVTLIVFLILLVLGSIIGFTIYKKNKLEKEKIIENQIRLDNLKQEYSFFSEGVETKNELNSLKEYLNKVIINDKEINLLDEVSFNKKNINIELIKDIENVKKVYNDEITRISNLELKDELDKYIGDFDSDEKEIIKDIYSSSNVIKNKEKNDEIISKYKDALNIKLEFLNFLSNNKNKYKIKDNKLVYKDDNFFKEISKFKCDLKLEKEKVTVNVNGKKVPVLMYHGVLDKSWGLSSLFVTVNEFEKQMKYLSENGYTSLKASEINDAKMHQKPIIITFDDGYVDVYKNALPILKKYNLKATIFVITGCINGDVYVTDKNVIEMDKSGVFEIGSHSVSHANLASLKEKDLENELKVSKETLEKLIGKSVTSVAYPFGSYNNNVVNMAKKYYKFGISTVPGKENVDTFNKYVIKRVNIVRNYGINNFINLVK